MFLPCPELAMEDYGEGIASSQLICFAVWYVSKAETLFWGVLDGVNGHACCIRPSE